MVLGEGVGLTKVVDLSLFALVGRFDYRSMVKCNVAWWVEERWRPVLGFVLMVITLIKGWFGFKFKIEGMWRGF